jgi:hypothetical protein
MGKIARAYGWDEETTQSLVAINPLGDEISLYKTQPGNSDEDIHKSYTRKGFTNITCVGHAPSIPGLVAVGQEDGLVKLFDISQTHSASLDIRAQAGHTEYGAANSVSFNSQGLLATGLARLKKNGQQQHSLLIYNVNHYSKASNQELHQPTFAYINNETIHSSVFYNETNILVGSSKFIRDIDIRVSSPVFQISSKTIHGITQDPYNQFNFAAFSEDGTLSIFDRRKLTNGNPEPSLSFSKLLGDTTRRNNYYCFRYNSIRRGEFGTSHSGELIRRWQVGRVPSNKYDSLFVSSVFDVKTKYDRVISFDYSEEFNGNMNLICMRQSGSVFKMPLVESEQSIKFNSFNDLILTGGRGTWFENVDEVIEKVEKANLKKNDDDDDFDYFNQFGQSVIQENFNGTTHNDADEHDEEDEEEYQQDGFYQPAEVLENDISVRMRKRAYMGYGSNCLKNLEVIDSMKNMDNNLFLRSTWKWLEIAHNSSTSGLMNSKDLDLSFEGVLGIWKGVDSLQQQGRFNSDLKEEIFKQQIQEILSTRRSKAISIVKSSKEPQRKLCMILAGFYFSSEELEEIYQKLMSNNQFTKAAGWAVFIGDIKKAVKILGSSKNNNLKLIATAISGYLVQKKSSEDNIWKDQCRQMSQELTDPYLKAIFAYIADNDWWVVLEESSLPLRERIGVALRCLSDQDLTIFLNKVSEKYVSRGELEGLILTGITPRGMDLLQSYVDRTSDVQTAALITSFGCPRYFKDERAENWVHSYRTLLNSWGMFSLRARYDVERAKLSRATNGKLTLKPIGSQIMIQCVRCNKNISKESESRLSKFKRGSNLHQSNQSISSSCPHCGSPLPKCAICLLQLGKPLAGGVSLDSANDSPFLDAFKQWPSFCLSCNHGMHAGHAEEWFLQSVHCPVPGCYCRCNNK